MGRRALKAVDPSVDLSSYLYSLDELQTPLIAQDLFGRDAPLEVEVGSGKGLFMQTASATHPDRNFLGIEMARKYARHAAGRLAKRELTNGKMISGDGLRLFREFLTSDGVDAVHVYFPDPWWKDRHRKRRVMKPDFLKDIQRVLRPGGALHFWTDVEEYFQTTLVMIAAEVSLEGPLSVDERPAEHDLDYRTHFERRMRLHDEPVYRSEFRKPVAN
ncbi:MAG: tRNA (guanosine(46)-N7)-methyltransferase TrmB [Planctomycetaceae bacterium]|nr:tRNA (guanosine(46)-N7)-methyltransferase TrmB [Planctomycetales bacterium]MCB9921094.1 tRNA (guanosine(46)-N7)-methyltransferase TrmB [Planctomycetaceae bacterium]